LIQRAAEQQQREGRTELEASAASAASSALEDIDEIDEIEEEDGFWEVIIEHEQMNDELKSQVDRGQRNSSEIIKDTVHQKIFVDSNMLIELGERYNCQIIFRRKNGRYAFFIRPNDTNYMINITNGIDVNSKKERIFFNLSLKDETSAKIKTEYLSEYLVDDGEFFHKYGMEGKPAVLKKNNVDLKRRETIFNPYLKLNDLTKKYFGTGERILMDSPLELIQSKIDRLRPRNLGPLDSEALQRITNHFGTTESKESIDKILIRDYAFLKRFINIGLGNTQIEEIDYRIPNKELFRTNNKFTDMLASRYATYIPNFDFTKSCDRKYTYTEPFPFKLTTPFTATDIYLHKFDRHFNEEYAMGRYDINSPDKLRRLMEMVELSKSLIFTFINTAQIILSADFTQNKDHQMVIDIHNVYPGLIWNRGTRRILTKKFIVNKIDSGRQGRYIRLEIEQLKEFRPVAIFPTYFMLANEIPFVGVFKLVDRNEGCIVAYKRAPVVPEEEKRSLEDIDLRGAEIALFGGTITRDMLVELNEDFFNATVEVGIDSSDAGPGEFVSLTPEEFTEAFPELGAAQSARNISKAPSVVMLADQENREVRLPVVPKPLVSFAAATATVPAATATVPATVPAVSTIRTQMPIRDESIGSSQNISQIIIDIRKYKKDKLKPLPGESRRLRGIRIKTQLEPMIEKLTELRRKQIERLRETGAAIPASVGKETAQLAKEGIIKLSRKQQAYQDLSTSVDNKIAELKLEADALRKYEANAKSKTQGQIAILMERILNEKRILYITIPNEILQLGVDTRSLSEKMYDTLKRNKQPIIDSIKALEAELKTLQERDAEEQAIIEETRRRLQREALQRVETEEEKKEKARRKMLEEDQVEIKKVNASYDSLLRKAAILKEEINRELRKTKEDSTNHKYYTYALGIIDKAVKSLAEHLSAVEYFAAERARPDNEKRSDEEMEIFRRNYMDTLGKSTENIALLNEVERNIGKNPEEIEVIATRLFKIKPKETGVARYNVDTAVTTEARIRSDERFLQKREEERRQNLQRLAELEKAKATKEAALEKDKVEKEKKLAKAIEKAVVGLTEEEAEAERQRIIIKAAEDAERIRNKTREDAKIYTIISRLYIKYKENAGILNNEIGRINTLLVQNKTRTENKQLSPGARKLLEKEGKELEEILTLLNNILEFKMIEHNDFLLKNEELIIENPNFKQDIKGQLLEIIKQFKISGLAGTLQKRREPFYLYLLKYEELIKTTTILKETTKLFLIKIIDKAKTEASQEVVRTVQEETQTVKKQGDDRKQFSKWEQENNRMFEEIKKLETELFGPNPTSFEGGITKRLKDVTILLSNPTIAPAKQKKLLEEKDELERKIKIVRSALTKRLFAYKTFLFANESLIRNSPYFKDKKLKQQLIERIDMYKSSQDARPMAAAAANEEVDFDEDEFNEI
jgi:hypothetical protein